MGRRVALHNEIEDPMTVPLYDGSMKVTMPPYRDAFRNFRRRHHQTLYSFSDTDTHEDPCRTECSACPEIPSPGFGPDVLAIGGWPCLCHPDYRKAIKAGDFRVNFTADSVPYEFLIAGAAFQSVMVKEAVERYFLRIGGIIMAHHPTHPDNVVNQILGLNDKRGATNKALYALVTSIPWDGTFQEQFKVLHEKNMNIRALFSAIYSALFAFYDLMNQLAIDFRRQGAVNDPIFEHVNKTFWEFKLKYIDWYCRESQGSRESQGCKFMAGVQMSELLHEEHDFSQPFDGWFEWRFIDKKNDPDHPPQSGPSTPGFKDNLPRMDAVHITKSILERIGSPYADSEDEADDTHGETLKLNELLRAKHGNSWDDPYSILPIGSGIAWWEQHDCDCSPLMCQPSVEEQVCEGGFNRVCGRVGGRSVAGPSGTTAKMLQNARLLNTPDKDLYLLRMGIIAWMVPMEDHSLIEILMGAEDGGVPYPHDSRMFSIKALLPGDELQASEAEMKEKLEILQTRFNLEFDASEGPRALCSNKLN